MKDEKRAKLTREIGLLSLRLESERRPMLLETILDGGLEKLRPKLTAADRKALRAKLAAEMLVLVEQLIGAENEELRREGEGARRRIASLEKRLSMEPVFTLGEIDRIRSLTTYGLSVKQVAKLFEVEPQAIKRALSRREPVAIPSLQQRAGRGRGKRALDLG